VNENGDDKMPKKESKFKDWGVQPHQGMRHNWDVTSCPHCNHDFNQYRMLYCRFIVGFTTKEEYRRPTYDGTKIVGFYAEGAVILECPKCFEHSWIHSCGTTRQLFDATEDDDNFLLVPGAKEAFLRSVKKKSKKKPTKKKLKKKLVKKKN